MCTIHYSVVESVFSELDEEPLGAASLAQCHRGVLKESGETVAVKIQHPDVQKNGYTDMNTIEVLTLYNYVDFFIITMFFPPSVFGGLCSLALP